MSKTIVSIIGVAAAIAIAFVAPPLGAAIFGTAVSASVATAIVTIGLSFAVSLALSFAMKKLGSGAPKAEDQVGPPQVFRQAVTSSFIVYGKRRVGGLLTFFHSRASGGQHYRYFVIAAAGHRCKGVVTWYLNDEAVTVDGSGKVTSGKYANAAWLWFQRGLSSETANATFVSECGGKWTSAHKGNDVAAIYAKFQMTDAVVQAGMPNITAVIEGKDDILDPRTAVAGYTRNAALIFYDWMKTAREEGGFGAYEDEIPDDAWISAQANVCDEVVNSAPRYAIDAVIQTGASPAEVRDALVVNMAGSYTFSGGKHLMRPGFYVPVSATLSEGDLAGAIQVSPFMPSDVGANEVQGTYINPNEGYQGSPFPTQRLTPAPDDVRQSDLDLAFTTNLDQAVRVARIMLNRAQAEKTVVWPMNIVGLKVKALDTVQLDTPRYGLSNYAWTVLNWGLSPDWGVVASLREENPEIYDEPVAASPVTPPTVSVPAPLLTSSETAQLIANSYATGLTFSVSSAGAVTISGHTRVYSDKNVTVNGTGGTPIATGAASGALVYIYYDDPDRAGGTVTYQALVLAGGVGDYSSAFASSSNPYRHFVATKAVPASGSTGGGSGAGSGGGGSGACVATDTPVLLADGSVIEAGAIERYMQLRTVHEESGLEGIYHVSAHRIVPDQPVFQVTASGKTIRATAGHRILIDGEWKTAEELGTPDGTADVVQMTVADAHTYVSGGLVSHNMKIEGL
ncbi:MAG TPA: Hint domain-containing protein [Sphingomicrobium sp.]